MRFAPHLTHLAALSSSCLGQSFGFHVVQPLQGDQNSRVDDMNQDGRRSVGASYTLNGSILDIGVDGVRTAVPAPPNYAITSLISGDGAYVAGSIFDSSVQDRYPARRLGTQIEILTTAYKGEATAINGDGSVIGPFAKFPFGGMGLSRKVAYRWTPVSGVQFIVDPFTSSLFHSDITGMSSDGSVMCGQGEDFNFGGVAFRWTAAQGVQRLPVPVGVTEASAEGISSDGQVIVGSTYGSGMVRHIMWTPDGMVDMGRTFGSDEHPFAVSLSGIAVMCGSQPSSGTAAIWSAQTGRVDLDDYLRGFGLDVPSDWVLWSCRNISDDGLTFAGTAVLPDGTNRGFIATVPAPVSFSLFFVAFGCTSLRRRRS